MPRKVFSPGERLFANDVNTFLMDQAVMVFADTAARTTAIPSPAEGMVTYLQDVDLIQVWNGSVWDEVSGAGITVSDTAPVGPGEGDLWFNSELGSTFVWYVDTDGGQWVEVGAGSGPTAAIVATSAPASAEASTTASRHDSRTSRSSSRGHNRTPRSTGSSTRRRSVRDGSWTSSRPPIRTSSISPSHGAVERGGRRSRSGE